MYKVLVVASTENILKQASFFNQSGFFVDYLISRKDSEYQFGLYSEQFIMSHELNVPLSDPHQLRTPQHEAVLKQNQHHLVLLKNYLGLRDYELIQLKNKKTLHFFNDQYDKNIFYFDQMVDLKVDKNSRKILLEMKSQPLMSYDFVFVEKSSLLAQDLMNKKIQLMQVNLDRGYQWVGFQFEVNQMMALKKYWLIDDAFYDSIYDNYYYIKNKGTLLDIWTFLPYHQLNNPEMFKYLSQRVQNKVEKKFDFLNLKLKSEQFMVQPIDVGFDFKLMFPNLSLSIPHFHFAGNEECQKMIQSQFDRVISSLKIKKENYEVLP